MPEVAINIGDKKFTVTCQPGEESALKKKKLAWFVGNNSQSVMYLKEGSWVDLELQKKLFPEDTFVQLPVNEVHLLIVMYCNFFEYSVNSVPLSFVPSKSEHFVAVDL